LDHGVRLDLVVPLRGNVDGHLGLKIDSGVPRQCLLALTYAKHTVLS
jgi:hypothetical protein